MSAPTATRVLSRASVAARPARRTRMAAPSRQMVAGRRFIKSCVTITCNHRSQGAPSQYRRDRDDDPARLACTARACRNGSPVRRVGGDHRRDSEPAGLLMSLPWRERLAMLLPPAWFYRGRIAEESRAGEPELAALDRLVRRGGTAVDIGANQGVFAFALGSIADRIVAFEPNPDYARFARWMLRGRVEVHALALADKPGRGSFYVPHADDGMVLHLAGSLKHTHAQFRTIETHEVEIRTLDAFALTDVHFIKADVEGSERAVLEGARTTIRARSRPRSAGASATTRSSFSAARPSRRCRRSRRSAGTRAGAPTSN